MILTGVIINVAAIIIGSAAGLLLKKGIPDSMGDSVMKGGWVPCTAGRSS